MPTFGSLFTGIGGLDLGLERAGWDCRWQVEWNPEDRRPAAEQYNQRVLAAHWPGVTRYGDIHDIEWSTVEPVDLLVGGFPCQPSSAAGKQLAQADPRWLWPQFARAIRDLRPRLVLVENVRNLLAVNRGSAFGEVLGDLARLGFDADWSVLSAAAVGAPHQRDRIWIRAWMADASAGRRSLGRSRDDRRGSLAEGDRPVGRRPESGGGRAVGRARPLADAEAVRLSTGSSLEGQGSTSIEPQRSGMGDTTGSGLEGPAARSEGAGQRTVVVAGPEEAGGSGPAAVLANADDIDDRGVHPGRGEARSAELGWPPSGTSGQRAPAAGPRTDPDANDARPQDALPAGPQGAWSSRDDAAERPRSHVSDSDGERGFVPAGRRLAAVEESRCDGAAGGARARSAEWWATEPDVGRVAHGVPARVDRLKGLGNAVVPQVAYVQGLELMELHEAIG